MAFEDALQEATRVPPEDERRRRVRVRAAREGRRCVRLLTGRMKERTLAPSASIPRRGRPLSRDPSSTIDRVVRARRSRDGIAAIDVRASLANARAGQFVFNCRPFLARGWVARSSPGAAREPRGEDANGGRSSVGVRARCDPPHRARASATNPRSSLASGTAIGAGPRPESGDSLRPASARGAAARRSRRKTRLTDRRLPRPLRQPRQKFSMRNRKTRWISWRRPSS